MIISVKSLLEMLSSFQPEVLAAEAENIDVCDAEIFQKFNKEFNENIIYLINSGDLEYINKMEKAPAIMICVDAAVPRPETLVGNAFGVLSGVTFFVVLNKNNVTFTEVFSVLNHMGGGDAASREEFKDILIDALYEGKSFRKILDISSQYIGNPVKLYNMAGFMIMVSSDRMKLSGRSDIDSNEVLFSDLAQENIASDELNKFITLKGAYYEKEQEGVGHFEKRGQGKNEPSRIRTAGSVHCAIKIRNIVTGFITVSGIYRPVMPEDVDKAVYVAKIISMKMQQETDGDMKGSGEAFLRKLVNADRDDNSVLRMQHAMLEKTFGQNGMRAVIIRPSTNRSLYNNRVVIKRIMRLFFENCIILFYDDDIMLLLNERDFAMAKDQSFEVFLRKNRLTAGISSIFRTLGELRDMYIQADRAISIGAEMNKKRNLCLYDELYIYDIIKIYARENSLKNICHNAVRQLVESGKTSDAELLRTLYVYLLCCGDTAEASDRLNIHRNTMYYRLEQIKKITGAQIDDGRQRFQMMLSFYSMRAIAEESVEGDVWKKASDVVFGGGMSENV